jgi:thiol-disulfide isomerase/thioredoxin
MSKVILFFADWCGFCKQFKCKGGTWEKIKSLLAERNVTCEEVDVDAVDEHEYAPPTSGVPQIAVVNPSGNVQYHVGATQNPQDILKMLDLPQPSTMRGSSKRKSGRRRSVKKSVSKSFNTHDLIWHVMEHCDHKKCHHDLMAALRCAQKCCM